MANPKPARKPHPWKGMKDQASTYGKTFPVEILTDEEVRSLIGACSHKAPTGIRNRAMIATIYRCALRISEALALKPKDVNRTRQTLAILHGKGDRARTVGASDGVIAAIDLWLATRKALDISARAPIFCTLAGGPLSTPYVRQLLPRLATKTGIDKRVHAHGLRHTRAADLMAKATPINVIQRILGHADLKTTAIYLNHVQPQQVIDAMVGDPWEL